jgi:hypothetical protein
MPVSLDRGESRSDAADEDPDGDEPREPARHEDAA